MKVMFVSQCSKNALAETRRIIDQFAERKGDCVWQTNITEQGLETVKRLLKATARRNTAVACHLFRGRLQTELLWIVGNTQKFNQEGSVPTHATEKDILRADDENGWNTGEAIAILARISGLFHDFGKANTLFQLKLKREIRKKYEPFRHEWISLLLFKEFVGESSDMEWLERLSRISLEDEKQILEKFPKNHKQKKNNPLKGLPKLARFIGWLILSHHRLPVAIENKPSLDNIDEWMEGKRFSALWNSYHCDDKDWDEKDREQVGSFPKGTPLRSESWCSWAKKTALLALKYYHLLDRDWFQDRFTMHMTRASLMMSDHFYSAASIHGDYQDAGYEIYANTERTSGCLKQRLDEHNIGVARNAFLIAKNLPNLRETLPSITRHKGFRKRSDVKFLWQDKAYDLAYGLKAASQDRGFLGVNLASTGCGKTLANARIMYGLSNEAQGCRFSIALGLRVLTLQTGEALQERLSLKRDDVAVMIGSKAFQQLHEFNNNKNEFQEKSFSGSESLEDLVEEQDYVSYEGSLDDGRLSRWLSSSPKLHKMVSAPILISTIDHLIHATEGCRGGKQIAPLLRLLTSDLVLDEPDDFDVADLPALCRFVNFAGVCGSRVLLSSATLPPSLVKALFEAYSSGRKIFNEACRRPGIGSTVCCAWFDEFGVSCSEHASSESYMSSHHEFIEARISQLEQQAILRRASLVPVNLKGTREEDVKRGVADSIRSTMYHLHEGHHQVHPKSGKRISVGLVRMANINPMVGVVKSFLSEPVKSGCCIHFCVYHSRFPLIVRSKIETVLDSVLSRHKPDQIWDKPEITSSLSGRSELNHIFVVFATAVAEVGRDHDYDWAIVEPSSMRSIIQLAGRVQRHRRLSPSEPNIMILKSNLNGLMGHEVAYHRPGFESQRYQLATKDLATLLHPSQFEQITAIPRLRTPDKMDFRNNLADLEHVRLEAELLGTGKSPLHASLWWKHNAHWCGELQSLTPFRKRNGEEKEYIMYLEEEGDTPIMHEWMEDGESKLIDVDRLFLDRDHFKPSSIAQGIHPWIDYNVGEEIERLAEKMDLSLKEVSIKFARVSLRKLEDGQKWSYHPILGFYQV